jgi:hypothetical protein
LLEEKSEDFQVPKDAGWHTSKDGIISNCPDGPAHDDDNLHEEFFRSLQFEALNSLDQVRGADYR